MDHPLVFSRAAPAGSADGRERHVRALAHPAPETPLPARAGIIRVPPAAAMAAACGTIHPTETRAGTPSPDAAAASRRAITVNELLAFDRARLTGETGDRQAWVTIAEFCANVPQHPVCRLDGGHNPNDNGPAGGDLNRGDGSGHRGNGGDLGWYPFS